MHDRNVDDRTLTFGNQGALYMSNMTWWDHETGSIWVQLTGRAERGELVGATLEQLPAYTGHGAPGSPPIQTPCCSTNPVAFSSGKFRTTGL